MTTQDLTAPTIARTARALIARYREISASVGDAPGREGEWSVREIHSYVLGDAESRFIDGIRAGLERKDHIVIDEVGLSQMTPVRESMNASDLAEAAANELEELGDFVAGLGPDQLARTVKTPPLAEFLGIDRLTIAQWTNTLFEPHLASHIAQLEALRQA